MGVEYLACLFGVFVFFFFYNYLYALGNVPMDSNQCVVEL